MGKRQRHPADHAASCGAAQSFSAAASRRSQRPKILVLGGSTEGFAVAQALTRLGYETITSFAGRTQQRREPAGFVRVGGFGGIAGFAAYLAVEDVALVIDATHPFAAKIKSNAAAACAEVGVPVIHLDRPAWSPQEGDDWRPAASVSVAARIAPATEGVCFLTLGRQEIQPFTARADLRLVIRVIDPPETPFKHPRATFLLDRGPFELDAERALFNRLKVGCVVAKNSGGAAAEAKLVAARERGIPVVMIDRPARLTGRMASSVDEAVAAASEMLTDQAA